MKQQFFQYFFLLFIMGLLATGCSEDMRKQLKPRPSAYGPTNQLVVIAEQDVWEGAVGDTFRHYYSSAYPLLPQPEPIFDLRHFTPLQLEQDPLRKELRNYIILSNLENEDSGATEMVVEDVGSERVREVRETNTSFTSVGRNKWANNQLLIYIFGYGKDNLISNMKKAFPAVKKRIDQANDDRIEASVYLDGEDVKLGNEIQNALGFSMRIPKDYYIAFNKDSTMWLRRETSKSSTNILLHKTPYTSQDQLTRENMKVLMDSLGKNYISSEIPGTYMQVNDKDLPMLIETKKISGNYALEARGIWELVNDYMGGPYVSYLTVDPNTNQLILIMGFIYAPGEKKRELMQNLEFVMRTAKI